MLASKSPSAEELGQFKPDSAENLENLKDNFDTLEIQSSEVVQKLIQNYRDICALQIKFGEFEAQVKEVPFLDEDLKCFNRMVDQFYLLIKLNNKLTQYKMGVGKEENLFKSYTEAASKYLHCYRENKVTLNLSRNLKLKKLVSDLDNFVHKLVGMQCERIVLYIESKECLEYIDRDEYIKYVTCPPISFNSDIKTILKDLYGVHYTEYKIRLMKKVLEFMEIEDANLLIKRQQTPINETLNKTEKYLSNTRECYNKAFLNLSSIDKHTLVLLLDNIKQNYINLSVTHKKWAAPLHYNLIALLEEDDLAKGKISDLKAYKLKTTKKLEKYLANIEKCEYGPQHHKKVFGFLSPLHRLYAMVIREQQNRFNLAVCKIENKFFCFTFPIVFLLAEVGITLTVLGGASLILPLIINPTIKLRVTPLAKLCSNLQISPKILVCGGIGLMMLSVIVFCFPKFWLKKEGLSIKSVLDSSLLQSIEEAINQKLSIEEVNNKTKVPQEVIVNGENVAPVSTTNDKSVNTEI